VTPLVEPGVSPGLKPACRLRVMRAMIVGASGTLGTALTARLPEHGYEVVAALGRQGCDLTNPATIEAALESHKPAVVFNAAAYTNVDGAESDTEAVYAANATGVESLAKACAVRRVRLVHYSTDFVFDGERERSYDEFDCPSPQGIYARSKVAGEQLAGRACAELFVLRVGCLYGQGGRNFPSTILRRLVNGETVRADQTRVASPTWVVPVADVSASLARTTHFGLYHCTANGETTWADYAHYLARRLGLSADRVEALPYGALKLVAPRPRRAILDNLMLRQRGLDTLGTWQEHAEGFIKACYPDR